MSLFLDTSGLLACFFDHGQTTKALLHAWGEEEVVVIALHADLEFIHEVRLWQAEPDHAEACSAALSGYLAASKNMVRRNTDPLYNEAALLVIRHRLAPGPALHLAVAIEFRDQILSQLPQVQDPVVFGTANPDLAQAARNEGFKVVSTKRGIRPSRG